MGSSSCLCSWLKVVPQDASQKLLEWCENGFPKLLVLLIEGYSSDFRWRLLEWCNCESAFPELLVLLVEGCSNDFRGRLQEWCNCESGFPELLVLVVAGCSKGFQMEVSGVV